MAAVLRGSMPESSDGQQEVEQVAERMPDSDDKILLSAYLKKGPAFDESAALSEWRPIFCALTETSLFLSIRGSDEFCVDRVPLREIVATEALDCTSLGLVPVLLPQSYLSRVSRGRKVSRPKGCGMQSPAGPKVYPKSRVSRLRNIRTDNKRTSEIQFLEVRNPSSPD